LLAPNTPLAPFIGGPGLLITVTGGVVFANNSTNTIPQTGVPLVASTVNYVYLTLGGPVAIATNTTGFPVLNMYPIAIVITNNSNAVGLIDTRPDYFLSGSGSGGGGTPGGSNTQIQFNSASVFGGSPNLTWVSPVLTIGVQGSTQGGLALTGGISGTTLLQGLNAGTGGTATFPANTGIVAELNLSQNWTALQTFNSGITGTGNTGALLAGSGILGSPNTWTAGQTFNANDLLINPGPVTLTSAGTTARTATLPDNTGVIAELNLAQVWTAVQTFAASNLALNPGPITLASAGTAARIATFPDNTGTVSELNLAQTWTALQTFSGNIALGGETLSASPRGINNTFFPGALTAPWTGSTLTIDKAITVTRIQIQVKTAPSGCGTNAIIRLTDGINPINITVSASANDSGVLAQGYSGGAVLTTAVSTAASGCTTSPGDANVVVQYRMQ
jgi:hypothetical protein